MYSVKVVGPLPAISPLKPLSLEAMERSSTNHSVEERGKPSVVRS
jgi:hypothetical protein